MRKRKLSAQNRLPQGAKRSHNTTSKARPGLYTELAAFSLGHMPTANLIPGVRLIKIYQVLAIPNCIDSDYSLEIFCGSCREEREAEYVTSLLSL